MVSPLGPILADVFVVKLENGTFQNTVGGLSAYCRKAYGIFLLVDLNVHRETLVGESDHTHSALSFTLEDGWKNFYFVYMKPLKTTAGKFALRVQQKPTEHPLCQFRSSQVRNKIPSPVVGILCAKYLLQRNARLGIRSDPTDIPEQRVLFS